MVEVKDDDEKERTSVGSVLRTRFPFANEAQSYLTRRCEQPMADPIDSAVCVDSESRLTSPKPQALK
jgi:hypothetical protein